MLINKSLRILIHLIIFFSLIFFQFTWTSFVLADGMIIHKPDPYADRWDYVLENSQHAFINFENGYEKLILSIGLNNNNSAVWIFPVPAEPNTVAIDVFTKFPNLKGEEIAKKAKSKLVDIRKALLNTQIYPAVFIDTTSKTLGSPTGYGSVKIGNLSTDEIPKTDVTIYEHLEKEGITTEILTAKTTDALNQYLQNQGLNIDTKSIPVLNEYIGKDYTFITSWLTGENSTFPVSKLEIEEKLFNYLSNYNIRNIINPQFKTQLDLNFPQLAQYLENSPVKAYTYLTENAEQKEAFINFLSQNPNLIKPVSQPAKTKQKGVFVTFPTKKIYYPLLLTSVYENEIIPTTIRVLGYVSPDIYPEIKNYTQTEYYLDHYFKIDNELESFYNGPDDNVKYTKIEITAPSKYFTKDLNINLQTPIKASISHFISQYPLASGILLLAIISIIAAIIAGSLIFKELRNIKGILALAITGLFNCLTIIGFILATMLIKTKDVDQEFVSLVNELKAKGYVLKHKIANIFLLVGLTLLVIFVFYFTFSVYMRFDSLLFISPAIIIIGFYLNKVKAEDKPLFAQLKTANYSNWTFSPKDNRKIIFIPSFSILFLALTTLVIKTLVLKVLN
jgi:hypothetical protein